jgi:hypothetical protein
MFLVFQATVSLGGAVIARARMRLEKGGGLSTDVVKVVADNMIEVDGKTYRVMRDGALKTLLMLYFYMFSIATYGSVYAVASVVFAMVFMFSITTPKDAVVLNPWLRLNYDVLVAKGEDGEFYIIADKDSEFERPRLSMYVADWIVKDNIMLAVKSHSE